MTPAVQDDTGTTPVVTPAQATKDLVVIVYVCSKCGTLIQGSTCGTEGCKPSSRPLEFERAYPPLTEEERAWLTKWREDEKEWRPRLEALADDDVTLRWANRWGLGDYDKDWD